MWRGHLRLDLVELLLRGTEHLIGESAVSGLLSLHGPQAHVGSIHTPVESGDALGSAVLEHGHQSSTTHCGDKDVLAQICLKLFGLSATVALRLLWLGGHCWPKGNDLATDVDGRVLKVFRGGAFPTDQTVQQPALGEGATTRSLEGEAHVLLADQLLKPRAVDGGGLWLWLPWLGAAVRYD